MESIDMISLIITAYREPVELLEACLASAAAQTLRKHEYEIIVVDNGSPDASVVELAASFVAANDNARLCRLADNVGSGRGRYEGVLAADGDYVLFLDGDDVLARNALERLREAAFIHQAEIVFCPSERWNPRSKRLQDLSRWSIRAVDFLGRMKAFYRWDTSYTVCGRLFARSLLTEDIFCPPSAIFWEDIWASVRINYKAKSAAQVHDTLIFYTWNPNSRSQTNPTTEMLDDFFWCLNENLELAIDTRLVGHIWNDILQGLIKGTQNRAVNILASGSLSDTAKLDLLEVVQRHCETLPMLTSLPRNPLLEKFSHTLGKRGNTGANELVGDLMGVFNVRGNSLNDEPHSFPIGLEPSLLALGLKSKIVFVCDVDYHLRNAASIARSLVEKGFNCVVVDYSLLMDGGRRRLPASENCIFSGIQRIQIRDPAYPRDAFSTARLLVLFTDWGGSIAEAFAYRNLLGLPSVAMVEGISDFSRSDTRRYAAQSYRRTDYVLLTGEDDQQYFEDRNTRVVGMPVVEKLSRTNPVFPAEPLVAINVNFTYGVLEWRRDLYVKTAVEGCSRANVAYAITQHPADMANLEGMNVTDLSQYELIEQCSVFVSRFATGIIEALAAGKPAIYFNPHGEKVRKFFEPLGAFRIARDANELREAIRATLDDIGSGTDFRQQAAAFLKYHADFDGKSSAVIKTSQAIQDIAECHPVPDGSIIDMYLDAFHQDYSPTAGTGLIGDFTRDQHAILEEEEFIALLFGGRSGLMLDVGASKGNACNVYLGKGWQVHAFEPDPANRETLVTRFGRHPALTINPEAVSNESGLELPFYASEESTGISSLSAFTSGHRQVCTVKTLTLTDYMAEHAIDRVDFLKIDVEGHDKFVLEGFPWDRMRPEVVLAEFEDNKTVPLGYNVHDLARFMLDLDYEVYVSEWHPIIRYGPMHDWRRIVRYSVDLELSDAWGNLVGFHRERSPDELQGFALSALKFNYPALVADPQPQRSSSPWIKARLKSYLKPVFLAGVRALKALERTERGRRIKLRIEDVYDRHIGRSVR